MTATGSTGFYSDERCFWHSAGEHVLIMQVGGWVQPPSAGGHAESPETKRRLVNLMAVSGLLDRLAGERAEPASEEDLRRVHPLSYLQDFKRLSDAGGGELGENAPFGRGSYEIAALSAGLAIGALADTLSGRHRNAYALCRPPGHHCLPDRPMGFCLLANIAIAIEAARARHGLDKVAVVDFDVHHGNGTEAIFYDRADVLTLSLHQENNYPRPGGGIEARGEGPGQGANLNIPLLPGSGHDAYLYAFDRIVVPALRRFDPDLIVVAAGFDASGVDPLSRMLAYSQTFFDMTARIKEAAEDLCDGRLVLVHEGGYSEAYVPFCAHASIEALCGIKTDLVDPLLGRFPPQQPNARFQAFQRGLIDEMAAFFAV